MCSGDESRKVRVKEVSITISLNQDGKSVGSGMMRQEASQGPTTHSQSPASSRDLLTRHGLTFPPSLIGRVGFHLLRAPHSTGAWEVSWEEIHNYFISYHLRVLDLWGLGILPSTFDMFYFFSIIHAYYKTNMSFLKHFPLWLKTWSLYYFLYKVRQT